MTKEELEKEAEEFTDSKKSFWRQGRTCIDSVKQAYITGAEPREKRIAELEAQIEEMQEKLKADLIAELKEQMQYSTSPSCTKGMELFIKSIEKWEIKEND